MTSLEERFQKGLEVRARLAGGEGRVFQGSVPVAYKLAPDMYRMTTECLYGAIWTRPGLDTRYRIIATLTAVVVQHVETQIKVYLRIALSVGLTPEEIVEILMQTTFFAGIPASYNALASAMEVFEERGIDYTLPESYDASIEPEALYEKGIAKHSELMPDVFGYYTAEPTEEEHELDLLVNQYLWGTIWTRPGLDMKSRLVCGLACYVGQGRYDQLIRRMIEGALRNGVARTEVMEIFIQLAFYVGVLAARAAMNIANTVFRTPEFSVTGTSGS